MAELEGHRRREVQRFLEEDVGALADNQVKVTTTLEAPRDVLGPTEVFAAMGPEMNIRVRAARELQ